MPNMTPEEKAAREAAVRAELNAEAEHVMNTSKPTPSQADIDAAKSGKARLGDNAEPYTPTMRSLAEQQARIAEAGGERPAYRTRQARADRFSDEAYPQHRELAKELEKTPAAPMPAAPMPAAPAPDEPVPDAIVTTASSGALTSGAKKP